jgi:hypothetical protein
MRIREAQKHTVPTDPDADSEHWYIYIIFQRFKVIKKVTKKYKLRIFLLYLLDDGRIRSSIRTFD